MPTVEPLIFDLCYRKEAYTVEAGTLKRDDARDATLPERPPQFKPLRGYHGLVAKQAEYLNKVQTRSGFLHYFFFPEVAEESLA